MKESKTQAITLLLVGNGFDLMHDMKSGWKNFQEWWLHQIESPQTEFVSKLQQSGLDGISDDLDIDEEDLESLYLSNENSSIEEALFVDICRCLSPEPLGDITWSDFETILGNLSLPDPDIWVGSEDEDWEWTDAALREDQALLIRSELSLSSRVRQWISTVKPTAKCFSRVGKLLDKADLIISFNYTDTIEQMYGRDDVWHIHGRLKYSGEKLIVGCPPHNDDACQSKSDSGSLAFSELNDDFRRSLIKNYRDEELKSRLEGTFISSVITQGISYGGVDGCYFEKIIEHTGCTTEWIAYFYKEEEQESIEQFLRERNYSGTLILKSTDELSA